MPSYDTPSGLQRLHQHVRQLRLALDLELRLNFNQLHANVLVGSPGLNLEMTVDFESSLSNARSCLDSIEKSLAMYQDKPSKIVCGRWV